MNQEYRSEKLDLGNEDCQHDGLAQETRTMLSEEDPMAKTTPMPGCFRRNMLLLMALLGVALGCVLGLALRLADPSEEATMWIGLPGEIFMNMLKALVLPLIICTMITGTASSDPQFSGRISIVTFGFIIMINSLGVVIGSILCLIPVPIVDGLIKEGTDQLDSKSLSTQDIFLDFIRTLFPANIVGAAIQKSQTKYTRKDVTVLMNVSGHMTNVTVQEVLRSLGTVPSTNILGIIVYSFAIGLAASSVGERSSHFVRFCKSLCVIIFKIFDWIKWIIPVGVASLIAKSLTGVNDLEAALSSVAIYLTIYAGGNVLLLAFIYPVIFVVTSRQNPLRFFTNALRPALIAAGPPSSAVALPDLIRIMHQEFKVDPRVVGFAGPMACSLCRGGTCVFLSYTFLFVCKMAGVGLTVPFILTTGALITMGSLAVPSVPSASLVVLLIVLSTMGVPPAGIGLVLVVEWLTDRIRTSINVISQFLNIIFVWRFCRYHLPQQRHDKSLDSDLDFL